MFSRLKIPVGEFVFKFVKADFQCSHEAPRSSLRVHA